MVRLMSRLMNEHPEVAEETDDHVMGELVLEGVPTTPNAEIAVCLLMCASDAAAEGDTAMATDLTVRAHHLVGEEACKALIKLIHESDAELKAERAAGEAGAADPRSDEAGE